MFHWLKVWLWPPITHSLHGKIILTPIDKNKYLAKLIGWQFGIEKDDFVIIKHGKTDTRYKVTHIKYIGHGGMFVAMVLFAPRW
jgi:hypothetical protein